MTQAIVPTTAATIDESQVEERLMTFAEYLIYEGEPDVRYELVRGKLIPMSAPTHLHTNICKYLVYRLQKYFADRALELVINALATGVRTEKNSSRIPDLVVFPKAVWEEVLDRTGAGVLDFPEKPMLVVEVTSSNARDDYVIKRNEYEVAEIPEYWIIDPKKKRVRVFTNPGREEGYGFVDYTGDEPIVSSQFQSLVISANELLSPPLVEDLIKEEQAQLTALEQQVETERQRAETLAQRLRELGVNPDELS